MGSLTLRRFSWYRRRMLRLAAFLRRRTDRLILRHTGGEDRPPFFDVDGTCPELRAVDRNYDAIRRELQAVLPDLDRIPKYHEADVAQSDISEMGETSWRVFFLFMRHGKAIPNEGACPETYRVVSRIPNVVDAFFSILEPHKSVPAHHGPFLGCLRYHTAFIVPEAAPPSIRVKDEHYTWKEGESMLFDDSHEHEVYNESDGVRVVLILDVFRPLPFWLDALNRFVGVVTRQGISDAEWRGAAAERSLAPVMGAG